MKAKWLTVSDQCSVMNTATGLIFSETTEDNQYVNIFISGERWDPEAEEFVALAELEGTGSTPIGGSAMSGEHELPPGWSVEPNGRDGEWRMYSAHGCWLGSFPSRREAWLESRIDLGLALVDAERRIAELERERDAARGMPGPPGVECDACEGNGPVYGCITCKGTGRHPDSDGWKADPAAQIERLANYLNNIDAVDEHSNDTPIAEQVMQLHDDYMQLVRGLSEKLKGTGSTPTGGQP